MGRGSHAHPSLYPGLLSGRISDRSCLPHGHCFLGPLLSGLVGRTQVRFAGFHSGMCTPILWGGCVCGNPVSLCVAQMECFSVLIYGTAVTGTKSWPSLLASAGCLPCSCPCLKQDRNHNTIGMEARKSTAPETWN